MANIAGLNIDNTSLIIEARSYRDVTFTFAGADTFAEGTIIAFNTSTKKYVIYVAAGINGTDTPVSVLTDEITATGAGDQPLRMLQDGIVRADLLIVDADLPTVGTTDQTLLQSLQNNNIGTVFSDDRSQFDNAV